jgi:hypothetical protein
VTSIRRIHFSLGSYYSVSFKQTKPVLERLVLALPVGLESPAQISVELKECLRPVNKLQEVQILRSRTKLSIIRSSESTFSSLLSRISSEHSSGN